MSPLRRQSTIFLQSKLTEELNSESPWIDGVVYSAFQEDPFRTLEGAAAPLEAPPALPTDHPLLSFDDDHFGPPSATSGDAERVGFADFTPDACNMVYSNQPDDLYATFSLSLSLSTIMTDCLTIASTTSTRPPIPSSSQIPASFVPQCRRR